MSISTFQEKIFKSGCGVAILLVSAVALSAGLFYTSCDNPNQGPIGEGGPVAVQVGEATVTAEQLQSQVQGMLAQFGQNDANVSPRIQAFALMQAINGTVQELANVQLAQQMGVNLTDESIRTYLIGEMDKTIKEARELFIKDKKLKPDATEAQFVEVYKKERGQTPEEMRKSTLESLDKALSDPAQKSMVLSQIAPQMIVAHLKKQRNPSDADVKQSYDSFTFKRILIGTSTRSAQEADTLANKVLGEVKGGGSFEQAMDRYSDDAAVTGKKKSDATTVLRRPDLASNPELKVLLGLKPGEVSGIIDQPVGKTIYKLISVKNDAPKDFEQKKQEYKDQYITQLVQTEMQAQLQQIVKSDVVKFPLPGYQAAHVYATATSDMALMNDPAAMEAKLREIAKMAEGATADENLSDDQAAVVVWYAAFDDLYNRASDKKALHQERVRVLETLLRYTENFDIRMDLVDLGVEMKNADIALQNLLAAAKANVTYDVTGDQRFRTINEKSEKLEKAGLLPAEAEQQIKDIQAEWRVAKAENAKAEAEFKAQEAKMKKEAEEAQKKLEAENKKAMEDQKQSAPATTGTGTPK